MNHRRKLYILTTISSNRLYHFILSIQIYVQSIRFEIYSYRRLVYVHNTVEHLKIYCHSSILRFKMWLFSAVRCIKFKVFIRTPSVLNRCLRFYWINLHKLIPFVFMWNVLFCHLRDPHEINQSLLCSFDPALDRIGDGEETKIF